MAFDAWNAQPHVGFRSYVYCFLGCGNNRHLKGDTQEVQGACDFLNMIWIEAGRCERDGMIDIPHSVFPPT